MSKDNNSGTRKDLRTVQKKKKRKRLYMFIFIPIAVILLAGGTYAGILYSKAAKTMDESYENIGRVDEKSDLREKDVDPVKDNVSVLIIGVDDSSKRDFEEGARSDALLLATFNKEEHDVKLLSIPRDSYMYIPEVQDYSKITHAHAYGGPRATLDSVERFLNVPVDYYMRVDFDAFIDVVDTLDGIEYNVPFEISEMDSEDVEGAIHLEPGRQHLNGEEALALARTRKYDSDVARGKRQQELIRKIADKAVSFSSALKLDDLMDAVGSNMKTNLTFDHMKSFFSYGINKDFSITPVNLEGNGGYLNDGLWYYIVDRDSRREMEIEMREQLGLPTDEAYLSDEHEHDQETEVYPDDPYDQGGEPGYDDRGYEEGEVPDRPEEGEEHQQESSPGHDQQEGPWESPGHDSGQHGEDSGESGHEPDAGYNQ